MKLPRLFPARGLTKPAAPTPQVKGLMVSYPVEQFFGITPRQAEDLPIAARRAFRAFALAHACMMYRATKLTEPPLWIAEEDADGEAMLEGEHPLSALFEQPNPDMEMAEFLTRVSLYLDYSGACLIVLNRDRAGRVGSMYPFAREEFSVEPADGRLYGRFQVQTFSGPRTLGPDEVIYLPRPSTEHVLTSVAPLDAALEHVNIGQNLRLAVRALMRNAVKPSLLVRTANSVGEPEARRLADEIRENWGGVHNQGKALFLSAVEEATPTTSNLKDLTLGDVNADVEAAICQVFQVHPMLVGAKLGVEGASGFADSIGPAQDLFYDVFAFPTWSWLEKKFTRALLRPIDENPRRFVRFDTSKVRALMPDMTEKIAQAAAAKEFWTEEEQRAHTGKEGGATELPSDRAERVAQEQRDAAEVEQAVKALDPIDAPPHALPSWSGRRSPVALTLALPTPAPAPRRVEFRRNGAGEVVAAEITDLPQ